ncbi:MAG: hypothetical protein NC121_12510 [Blautia sp.]|nr:hypothetical protein [Blautia sp.]
MYEDYLARALSNVIISRQAIYGFEIIHQKDLKNGASYHAQHAIELMLKFCIYNNAGYNKNSSNIQQLRTHDINRLITQYCVPLGIDVPKKIAKNAKTYSTWEAESRYSLSYSVRIDSVKTALDKIEQWLIKLKPTYRNKILQVRNKLNVLVRFYITNIPTALTSRLLW